jgi:hypothetical protein
MSKVRLTGATSGYTEITAPAVAGSNTITLPTGNGSANQLLKNGATAGSLEFASNVVIDSSGRLLVGTSSSTQTDASVTGCCKFNHQQTKEGCHNCIPLMTQVLRFSFAAAKQGQLSKSKMLIS